MPWTRGHLKEGTLSFEVRRPKYEEECPEVSIREGPEELTLRAEDVGSQKACSNVDHIAEDRWGPLLVDADWHAFFARRSAKALKEVNGKSCTFTTGRCVRQRVLRSHMTAKKRKPSGK